MTFALRAVDCFVTYFLSVISVPIHRKKTDVQFIVESYDQFIVTRCDQTACP